MNRRFAERASGVDRHDLVRFAADHDLIVRPGRKAEVRRSDPHLPVALLDHPGDLARAVLPPARLDRNSSAQKASFAAWPCCKRHA
jgi:hypothetical protein